MAHILQLQHSPRQTLERVNARIGAIARAVVAERSLALRAATKAASPRQCLAEVRAMCVQSLALDQQSDFIARADNSVVAPSVAPPPPARSCRRATRCSSWYRVVNNASAEAASPPSAAAIKPAILAISAESSVDTASSIFRDSPSGYVPFR